MDKSQERFALVLNFLKKNLLPDKDQKMPMIDAMPVCSVISIFSLYLIILAVFVIVNGVWRLDSTVNEENLYVVQDDVVNFYENAEELNFNHGGVDENHFVKANNYLKIFLYMRKKDKAMNVAINEEGVHLTYTLDLYLKDSLGMPYETIKGDMKKHLICDYSPSTKGSDLDCDGIELFFSETVPCYRYVLNLRLDSPLESLILINETVATVGFRYEGSGWLITEIVLSWLIWILALVFFMIWMVTLCTFNGFHNWTLEQRMVKILFVLAILYIDPFYFIDDVFDTSWVTYVFKFGDTVVLTTFVIWLFFCIQMFSHWIDEKRGKRNIISWGYSVILAAIFWILLLIIMLSYRYTRQFMIGFKTVGYTMLITTCFLFSFSFFRQIFLLMRIDMAVSKQDTGSENFMVKVKRLIMFFGIGIPTIYAVFIICVVKAWEDQLNIWFYECLMLLICFVLAICFLPSWKLKKELDEGEEQMRSSGDVYGEKSKVINADDGVYLVERKEREEVM